MKTATDIIFKQIYARDEMKSVRQKHILRLLFNKLFPALAPKVFVLSLSNQPPRRQRVYANQYTKAKLSSQNQNQNAQGGENAKLQRCLRIGVYHPAHIKELKYNENTIKKSLNFFAKQAVQENADSVYDFLRDEIGEIERVDVFDSKYVPQKQVFPFVTSSSEYRYVEMAEGEFENLAKRPDIAAIFEEWREIVQRNNRLSQIDDDEDNFYTRIND